MRVYQKVMEELREKIKELEHAEVEYSGEIQEIDLSGPLLYAFGFTEGVIDGCLAKAPIENIPNVGAIASGVVTMTIVEGAQAVRRNGNQPGGYA